jgi:hypothetical protein
MEPGGDGSDPPGHSRWVRGNKGEVVIPGTDLELVAPHDPAPAIPSEAQSWRWSPITQQRKPDPSTPAAGSETTCGAGVSPRPSTLTVLPVEASPTPCCRSD